VRKQRVDKLSGGIGSPLTCEQRREKFHSCARRVLRLDKAERIVALVEKRERLANVDALMTLTKNQAREKSS